MFQLVHPSGQRYNPGRDIVQLYPRLAHGACIRLAAVSWHSAVRKLAAESGLTETDLTKGAEALARFINEVTSDRTATPGAAWMNSGLGTLPPAVVLTLFFQLGLETTDAYYKAVRAASQEGKSAWGVDRAAGLIEQTIAAVAAPTATEKSRRLLEAAKAADKVQDPDVLTG